MFCEFPFLAYHMDLIDTKRIGKTMGKVGSPIIVTPYQRTQHDDDDKLLRFLCIESKNPNCTLLILSLATTIA